MDMRYPEIRIFTNTTGTEVNSNISTLMILQLSRPRRATSGVGTQHRQDIRHIRPAGNRLCKRGQGNTTKKGFYSLTRKDAIPLAYRVGLNEDTHIM